jgi:hypothetical protein
MAGSSAERQEMGVIKDIINQIKKTGPVNVRAGSVIIKGVTGAKKYSGRQIGGSEPYTDVQLIAGEKTYNLSLKGETAPSLAGGGLKGLELAVPGIAKKFMQAAYKHLTAKLKLTTGDKIPDIYGQIEPNDKVKIVVGNAAMGGPIDYMYIGPMTVASKYDILTNTLMLNGTLTEAKKYANSHDLYFRLRARREDQRFDKAAKDNFGVPKIYGKSPSRGDTAGRIVVTDKTPSQAEIVKIK